MEKLEGLHSRRATERTAKKDAPDREQQYELNITRNIFPIAVIIDGRCNKAGFESASFRPAIASQLTWLLAAVVGNLML